MLAIKRSEGVVPEVNLRNFLHKDVKHTSIGSTLTLKSRADNTTNSKQKYQYLVLQNAKATKTFPLLPFILNLNTFCNFDLVF